MSELKPCPFCGNTNLHHTETSIFHAVWCKDCGAMVDIDDGDAIKLWNTRPLEDALQKRIAELEEAQRWKPLSELPEENMEVLVKTDRNYILIVEIQQIEEFNYDEHEHFGYGLIEHFMALPEAKHE